MNNSPKPPANADERPMNTITRVETQPSQLSTVAPRQITALDLMQAATAANMTPESIEKFLAMHERIEANNARKAYHAARAAFKRDCPPIVRRTENNQFFVTVNGTKRPRRYASRTDIAASIDATLADHGLSYDWTGMKIEAGKLSLTCVISHVDGHSTSSTVTGLDVESKAGCSDLQKSGTAQEYAMRYSLIQALGLTSCDDDTDGNQEPTDYERITEAQAIQLEEMLDALGADPKEKFKAAYKVDKFGDIAAADWTAFYNAVKKKLDAKAKGGAA